MVLRRDGDDPQLGSPCITALDLTGCFPTGLALQDHGSLLQGRISWAAAGHPARLARSTTTLKAIMW